LRVGPGLWSPEAMSPRTRIIGLLASVAAVGVIVFAVVPALGASHPKLTLKSENVKALGATVLADSHGRTLYRLKPETAHHVLCTSSACLSAWPPTTVASKSTTVKLPSGVHGTLGFLKRGKRFQVTYKGLPLYRFAGDGGARQGNGQDIHTFGGVWKALPVSKGSAVKPPASSPAPSY
jgi:predicted lipoprotein with Yx(FWY)xxD motif